MEQNKLQAAIERYSGTIYPSKEEFFEALSSRKLVIYHGVDPTAPELHLGHSTNYLLLKKLQQAGHKVILLIGDFTARIGDPSGRDAARKPLTAKEVKKNMKSYKSQAEKVMDFKEVKIKHNSKWLSKLRFPDIIELSSNITVQQMIQRDMFQRRIKNNLPISLHEFMYPLMQGYDSVAMNVDAEVGGMDQTFNMLVGRDLLKKYKNKEKFVITTLLLENPKTGKKLMSKSEGNVIALNDQPNDMYGKVMALPDETIIPCFKLCTEVPLKEIESIERNMENPRDAKAKLAKEIVTLYHGSKIAEEAEKEFDKVFRKKELPSEIPTISMADNRIVISDTVTDLTANLGLADSKSEAKRLIIQKALEIDGKIQTDWKAKPEIKKGSIIKVGKRKFIKIEE